MIALRFADRAGRTDRMDHGDRTGRAHGAGGEPGTGTGDLPRTS
ncbi:hypothetical protein GCM10009639_69470 [Kitasatospora putterlickiae]|uniref:Uncharacterized protein n=1 Tax=Kitasatospora putterlickiae TaxID=221725 RepID=A0ABP4J7S0_9ACTN